MFKLFLYKIFIKIYYFFYSNFGIKLKGVGYFSEFIEEPFIFKFKNTYFYFNPKVSGIYSFIISDIKIL